MKSFKCPESYTYMTYVVIFLKFPKSGYSNEPLMIDHLEINLCSQHYH